MAGVAFKGTMGAQFALKRVIPSVKPCEVFKLVWGTFDGEDGSQPLPTPLFSLDQGLEALVGCGRGDRGGRSQPQMRPSPVL